MTKFPILRFSLVLLFSAQGFTGPWQSKNRVQIGCEVDNNVYEAAENQKREPSLRLLFQTQWERQGRNSFLNFSGVVGYQGYPPAAREDKITNEWQFRLEQGLSRRITAGIDGWVRFKHFLYDSIDYHLASANGFVRVGLPRNGSVMLSLQPRVQNYWSSLNYDYQGLEMKFSLIKRFSRQFSAEVTATRANLRFKRNAYWQPTSTDSLVFRGTNQKDRIGRAGFQVRYYRGFFVSGGYFYETYQSNNYGFSYARHRWVGSLSKKLSRRLLLRLYGMLQKKNYRESLVPLIPLQLDPEKDDSNFFIFDISQSLTPETALFIRLSWYNNESLFRTQYYQKQTFIFGVESRF